MTYAVREKCCRGSFLRADGWCIAGRDRSPIVYFDTFEEADAARTHVPCSAVDADGREVVRVQWALKWKDKTGQLARVYGGTDKLYRPYCGGSGATLEKAERFDTRAAALDEQFIANPDNVYLVRLVKKVKRLTS